MGQFNIAMDKRNVYDWDTRIHLLARGPGIKQGMTWDEPATQVDLAPTFLGIAGVAKPPQMDGKSLLPLLTAKSQEASSAGEGVMPPTVAEHVAAMTPQGLDAFKVGWRDSAFIEYYCASIVVMITYRFYLHTEMRAPCRQ